MKKLLPLFLILFSLHSCRIDEPVEKLLEDEFEISLKQPPAFGKPVNDFSTNPITYDGFMLGKSLFYDGILASDPQVPCGSCHQQVSAFANTDHTLSHGVDNQLGLRNAPPIFNLAWYPGLMWDGGINHLEVQAFAPITNPVEMNETLENVVSKLQAHPRYPAMFKKAFGSDSITTQNLGKALAQFMGAMVSSNAKYDRVMAGSEQFSESEKSGLETFRQKCASCHTEPLFTDHSFRNNGLKPGAGLPDEGRKIITGQASDSGKFRVPSLRNIEVTAPYMHDGRFWTLERVIDHYRSAPYRASTLDPSLSQGISLSDTEKTNLIAFLKTLTDHEFLKDKRFEE
jgi:cytochrome c peroxidase